MGYPAGMRRRAQGFCRSLGLCKVPSRLFEYVSDDFWILLDSNLLYIPMKHLNTLDKELSGDTKATCPTALYILIYAFNTFAFASVS